MSKSTAFQVLRTPIRSTRDYSLYILRLSKLELKTPLKRIGCVQGKCEEVADGNTKISLYRLYWKVRLTLDVRVHEKTMLKQTKALFTYIFFANIQ